MGGGRRGSAACQRKHSGDDRSQNEIRLRSLLLSRKRMRKGGRKTPPSTLFFLSCFPPPPSLPPTAHHFLPPLRFPASLHRDFFTRASLPPFLGRKRNSRFRPPPPPFFDAPAVAVAAASVPSLSSLPATCYCVFSRTLFAKPGPLLVQR